MNMDQADQLEFPATLFLCDGLVREGTLFASRSVAPDNRARTPLDLANGAVPFFALRKADGSISLVNKAAVSHLRVQAAPATAAAGYPLEVRIIFAGGETLQGTLPLPAPGGKACLPGFLSDHRGYLLLDCGTAHYLVNSRLICELIPF